MKEKLGSLPMIWKYSTGPDLTLKASQNRENQFRLCPLKLKNEVGQNQMEHSIYIRTVSSCLASIIQCSGTFVSFLASPGQR